MKKIVLTKSEFDELMKQLQSPDKENHTVAFLSLESCDIEASLPYILTLFFHTESMVDGGWASAAPKVMDALGKLGIRKKPDFDQIYYKIKGKYSEEAVGDFLDYCSAIYAKNIEGWGWKFLGEMNITMRPKK